MIPDGYVFWSRLTVDSEIFTDKPDIWFKVWFYIVLNVNYKDSGKFSRGENFFNYEMVKSRVRLLTKDQWKKILTTLRKMKMIGTTKSTRGIIIKVLNYDKYQQPLNYTGTTDGTISAPHRHHYKQERKKEINNKKTYRKKIKKISPTGNPEEWVRGKVEEALRDTDWLMGVCTEFQVPRAFVVSKGDDMVNYCVQTKRYYENYKLAIRNWVKKDSIKIRSDQNEKRQQNRSTITTARI